MSHPPGSRVPDSSRAAEQPLTVKEAAKVRSLPPGFEGLDIFETAPITPRGDRKSALPFAKGVAITPPLAADDEDDSEPSFGETMAIGNDDNDPADYLPFGGDEDN